MKKILAAATCLLPILYAICLAILAMLDATDTPLLIFMLCYCIISLVLHMIYCLATNHVSQQFLAGSNLWFYGVNLVFFLAEIVFWAIRLEQNRIAEQNGAMGGGLGLVLLILIYLPHWFSYLLTRITGAINCERTLRGLCNANVKFIHSALQLFPGADLISAIWVYHRTKQDIRT